MTTGPKRTASNLWGHVALGDLITLQRGFDLPTDKRQPGLVPVISSSGITGTHALARVRGPGVVTGRYGTIGQVFYITHDYWPLNTTLYVKDFNGNDPRFISYLLKTVDFASCSDKSSVPGVNRNHLHAIAVSAVPLPAQRAIAAILGALDDKIELNRRMNRTLEAMAQALFQSWFVDFDPVRAKMAGRKPAGMDAETAALFPNQLDESPHGAVPSGWRRMSLDQTVTFLNGLALQKYPAGEGESLPVIKIAELHAGVTETSGRASAALDPKYIVEDGDVLFSWSGSLDVVLWAGGRGALNQHLFKVTSADYPRWFFYHWIKAHLLEFRAIAAGKATTMGHIQRHHLAHVTVLAPPRAVASYYCRCRANVE